MNFQKIKVEDLVPASYNPRKNLTPRDPEYQKIKKSIENFGYVDPIIANKDMTVIGGHQRLKVLQELGYTEVECVIVDLDKDKEKALNIALNKITGEWDDEALKELFLSIQNIDLELTGFDLAEIEDITTPETALLKEIEDEQTRRTLAEQFLVTPFSVFNCRSIINAREGFWQRRKKAWLSLGIESEKGRKGGEDSEQWEGLIYKSASGGDPEFYKQKREWEKRLGRTLTTSEFDEKYYKKSDSAVKSGTSIFDPVLCEVLYTWFSPVGGVIFDPFAGGSVRGVIASKLKRHYHGHELRAEQIEANREQAEKICTNHIPKWIEGDSRKLDETVPHLAGHIDFVFSCPPYADLEKYSDDPADLSNMDYEEFREAYFEIIRKSCEYLKEDRFAAFVVGEVRDDRGNYYNFVGDTIEAFIKAGLRYYNEAILVTSTGSLAVRVGRQFKIGRKLGKTHQNVLIFVKGDSKKATEACGEVEIFFDTEDEE